MKVITVLCLLPLAAVSLTGQSRPNQRVPGPSVGMLPAPTGVRSRLLETYGRLPLAFEANQGQTDQQVKFVSRGAGYNLFLTATEAVLTLQKVSRQESNAPAATALPPQEEKSAVLHMKLLGGNAKADVFGQDELPGKSNYFMGNDPKKWHAGVWQYGKVRYAKVYPGVDLVYYGNQREIEYDFVVAPGADPRRIQFDMGGARRIRQNEEGDLVLTVGEGEIRWHKPIVYQEKDGRKQLVAGHYVISDKTRVSFEVGKYDAARPLYIDPLLYSSYLGGRKFDQGTAIALDSAGNAYVTGYTESNDFPTMNPEQPKTAGGIDAFVVKMNPSGSAMVYATYLGGTLEDTGDGIAVDSAGNAYVTGFTQSTNFPTKNPLQPNLAGQFDIYVAKLDPTGSSLVYSTYLGGTDQEQSASIAVNSAGFAFVTGQTWSVDFPTTPGAFQTVCKFNIRCVDAFVSKISPSGSALVYSTLLGGKETDLAGRIAVDSADNVYLTGYTESDDFPTMNPLQPSFGGGGSDAFVAKLNPAGSALVYSTYLGGTGNDLGSGIAVDNSGNVYVAGATSSTDFPTANALQPSSNGDFDAFVTKINAAGSALVYSTYLGGTGSDFGVGIAADSSGNAYVAGTTGSNDIPTESSLQPYGHNFDAFVTKITPSGSSLVYSTYLGGSKYDNTAAIALENSGNVYIVVPDPV